jgi:hypothetical protein
VDGNAAVRTDGDRTMRFTRRLAWLAALALTTAAQAQEHPDVRALRALSGTWTSPAPEPWYGAWGTRSFTFSDGRWSLDFLFALDPAMAHPVFRFRTGGPYAVGAASAAVPGAFEAVFGETTKHLTLLTTDAALAARMGLAECGLTVGVEADISVRGCASWKPVAVCGEDHDLLALDPAGRLRFGVRPRDNDMCTPDRRPTALLPPVLRQ